MGNPSAHNAGANHANGTDFGRIVSGLMIVWLMIVWLTIFWLRTSWETVGLNVSDHGLRVGPILQCETAALLGSAFQLFEDLNVVGLGLTHVFRQTTFLFFVHQRKIGSDSSQSGSNIIYVIH